MTTRDSAATVGALLADIEWQTLPCEPVVVDSGPTDATLDQIEGRCDRLVRLPAAEYTPGRALNAGWRVAYVPGVEVEMTHRWRQSSLNFFRRTRHEHAVLGTYVELLPYGLRELVSEWWSPQRPRRALAVELTNPRRLLGLSCKYAGHRAARRAMR